MVAWYDFKESVKASGKYLINMEVAKNLAEEQQTRLLKLLLVYDLLQLIMLVPKESEKWSINNLNPNLKVIKKRMEKLNLKCFKVK